MSLQSIINSAQSIEISRPALVASSLSRSGRLITGARNWVKPWNFKVVPKPLWPIAQARPVIEDLMNNDRHTEQTISLGQTSGGTWTVQYLGSAPVTNNVVNTITMVSAVGTSFVIGNLTGLTNGQTIFKAGDIIQPVGHRYPYVVRSDVVFQTGDTTKTFLVNRGYLPQTNYTVAGQGIAVGTGVTWRVKLTKLPSYRYVSGQLVEFTDDFEIIESIL